jgi:glycosyltransferase involved in cell wall biosynthesis
MAVGGAIPNLISVLMEDAHQFGFRAELLFGRGPFPDGLQAERVGKLPNQAWDLLSSRLFDSAGRNSLAAATAVLGRFRQDRPDLVHIHNLHGYWMNQGVLLRGLVDLGIPIVWTLHDYWPVTGHCVFFEKADCEKWRFGCGDCPQIRDYPQSYSDRSSRNYRCKQSLYGQLDRLHIVAVSRHAQHLIQKSILSKFPITAIYNAVETRVFRPVDASFRSPGSKVVGCVARHWDERKGLSDILKLRELLDESFSILVVGLKPAQIRELPSGIVGMPATMSPEELAGLYSSMDVFFNPSREETFGLTTVEAMACGVPVVLYDVSATREIQPEITRNGIVEPKDVRAAARQIRDLAERKTPNLKAALIKHVESSFSVNSFLSKHYALYEQMVVA